jgi:alpha-tubulin suppressor-like RCC1 family protein
VAHVPGPNNNFVDVSAGYFHILGLKVDGSIVGWGDDNGVWGTTVVPQPNAGFTAVAAGGFHSLGLRADGSVSAWGSNVSGQCNVPEYDDFVAIAAGRWHSLGLRADGSIMAWGLNNQGQCDVPDPNSGFIAIAAGYELSVGLKE